MTIRLFGTEIRSVEPTVAGWLVAIACYYPFWPSLIDNFFAYTHGVRWGAWLTAHRSLHAVGSGHSPCGAGSMAGRPSPLVSDFPTSRVASSPRAHTASPSTRPTSRRTFPGGSSAFLSFRPMIPFTALPLCLGLAGINVDVFPPRPHGGAPSLAGSGLSGIMRRISVTTVCSAGCRGQRMLCAANPDVGLLSAATVNMTE